MEDIEVEELYSVSLSTVQANNGLSWSEDHKVSLISSSALHILEVVPNSSATSGDMCLKKSIIKPSDYTPTADAGVDTSRLIYQLEQRDAYRLLLDMKLAPHLPDAKSPEPRYTCAQWSPARMYQDHRCMVATLTCTGCLKLLVPHFNCWVEVTDLSCHWVQYCKKQWSNKSNETNADEAFEVLQRRSSLLKITGMVWSQLMIKSDQKKYSLMATVSHCGTLTLWKLKHLIDLGLPAQDYKPNLLTVWETEMYNACSLHWIQWNTQEMSIVIGDMKGCVKMVSFLFNNHDDTVSFQFVNDVWKEKDQMQVTCINSFLHSSLHQKEQRILGVTKNSFFLAFLVTQRQVLSYCHNHIGGLPLTGLEVLGSTAFITSTMSGVLYKYEIILEHSAHNIKLSISSKLLKSNLTFQEMACFGMAKNFNSDVWALCTNVCKFYDHLVMRRPSQIVFFILNNLENSGREHSSELAVKISASKLRFNWETLEIFRMNYLKQLKTQLPKDIQLRQDLETLSTNQLQMELWRARIVVTHLVINDVVTRYPEACAYVTLLEELLLCRHACKHICTLIERHKMHPLEEKGLSTLGLLRLWLQIWLSHNKTVICGSSKNSVNETLEVSNSGIKEITNDIGMEINESPQISASSFTDESVSGNVGDNDTASVGSFDDAISTDSNSSSIVSEGTVISKRSQIQQGRIRAGFMKAKLTATCDQVTNVLALPVIPGILDKELCAFCDLEVQMDIDWRCGTCPANHRLSRCCHCLSCCHQMPYRLCAICPTVACMDIDCDLEPFCTFCDSPLIIDEKFKRTGFSSPSEEKEKEKEIKGEKERQEDLQLEKKEVHKEEKEGHEETKEREEGNDEKKEGSDMQEKMVIGIVLTENENNSEVSMEIED